MTGFLLGIFNCKELDKGFYLVAMAALAMRRQRNSKVG
jgi:hypothetical protein